MTHKNASATAATAGGHARIKVYASRLLRWIDQRAMALVILLLALHFIPVPPQILDAAFGAAALIVACQIGCRIVLRASR